MALKVTYSHGNKTLFTFSSTKYWHYCACCGNLTTRKMLTSKGVLAKELFAATMQHLKLRDDYVECYRARFFCSEACIKKLIFQFSITGGVKIRKRVEAWLNQPPQEYCLHFGALDKNKFGDTKTHLLRVVKNQGGSNCYVEFYQKGSSYASHKPIQFYTSEENILSTINNISNLFTQNKVEENNA